MTFERLARVIVSLLILSCPASPAFAQGSLSDALSFLLTTQSVPTGDFVKDEESAEITRDTISRLLLSELTTMPLSSSSGGFSYRFNPALGTVERASDTFGPFFTERSLMIGAGRASVGGQVQVARFSQLGAFELRDGTFVTTANRFRGDPQPFDTEALTLEISSTTFTLFGHLGLHQRVDLGLAVPFIRLALDGSRLNVYRGTPLLQANATARATGLGDVAVRAKVNVIDAAGSGLALIEEVRLPTGREEDLLGAGAASFRTVGVGSHEAGRVAAHGNLGLTLGGLSEGFDYRGAVTFGVLPQLTVVGELLGRRMSDVGQLTEEVVRHPLLDGVETIRLVTTGESVTTAALVVGTKWNVRGTWLVNANLSIPLTKTGLRSDVLMLFGLDYAFEW